MVKKVYLNSLLEVDAFLKGVDFAKKHSSKIEVIDVDKYDKARSNSDPFARWYVEVRV
jgi:hypothetical protein